MSGTLRNIIRRYKISKIFNPGFKKGELIRNVKTGQPLLVIHVFTGIATLASDPTQPSPALPILILRSDYTDWVEEKDIEYLEKKNEWLYNPVML